ncbi:hypothetical protein EGW08_003062 [Elysia chlorotica]|uniref:Palmitoyltransferase n=1 Tax=Elysia chlorotica TaxID=188477 RepID=A0A3S1BQR6_ELYCH|nr:hypothetical protein EGW08_003062 [Elysia chlorotica]
MAPRCCLLCCRAMKWTPVVFISAIIAWSYYAYVVQMCILIFLLLYHPILILFVWSYYQTIFAKLRGPPKEFYLSQTEWQRLESETNENNQKQQLENFAKKLPIQNRTIAGFPRYCEKCKTIKPDRCHHCSVCSSCVLKMDHHCPWVNNCVGFHNYKFFVLFLGYALLYCFYVAVSSLKYFLAFWSVSHGTGRFHVLFLFFVGVMFGISLTSLFGYHLYLTVHNRSTLESFRAPVFQTGPDKNGFSLGSGANFAEVFGDNKLRWFLPVFTSMGDGVTYPTRTVDLDSDGLLGQRQRWMEEGDQDSSFENRGVDMA